MVEVGVIGQIDDLWPIYRRKQTSTPRKSLVASIQSRCSNDLFQPNLIESIQNVARLSESATCRLRGGGEVKG